MTASWMRFEWNLGGSTLGSEPAASAFVTRDAQKQEEETVQRLVVSSFSMDSGWGDVAKSLQEILRRNIEQTLDKGSGRCLALLHGTRIIGVSVLDTSEESEAHLVSGPCILAEYRSRGLGTQLLRASLVALKEAGLRKAYGVTRARTTSDRFVYPKFGGVSAPWTPDFEILPRLAA